MKLYFLLGLCALCACATTASGVPVSGDWGGTHVGLRLTQEGGTLDYDCAAGTIAGPLMLRGDGSFTVDGMHTPGWGGPEVQGQVLPTYRVRYTGTVRGNAMTLQGRVENGVLLGPFTLRRGAEPIIFRCL